MKKDRSAGCPRRMARTLKRVLQGLPLFVALALAVTGCASGAVDAQKARQAIYDVLREAKDVPFACGESGYDDEVRTANVTDLRQALNDADGSALTPQSFTVLDLDGDGTDEAVLETDDGWAFVLHAEGGGVRGYYYSARWFNTAELKTDGTAGNSGSAETSGVGRLRFTGNGAVETQDVLHREATSGGTATHYTVGGEEVDEAAFDKALADWQAQPSATWYSFTPENLAAVFSD